MVIKVRIDASNLNLQSLNIDKLTNNALDRISQDMKETVINNTPQETGVARSNWSITKAGNIHTVQNTTKYLKWVNDGTGLYGPAHRRITPTHASVLHFYWKGREWFLKSVRGQKPQKFVEKSIDETKSRIDGFLVSVAEEVL